MDGKTPEAPVDEASAEFVRIAWKIRPQRLTVTYPEESPTIDMTTKATHTVHCVRHRREEG